MIQKELDRRIAQRNRDAYWKAYQMREAERERKEKEAKNEQGKSNRNS